MTTEYARLRWALMKLQRGEGSERDSLVLGVHALKERHGESIKMRVEMR